jgi:hypothetical protein
MPVILVFGRWKNQGWRVLGQPGLHSETLSLKERKEKKKKENPMESTETTRTKK